MAHAEAGLSSEKRALIKLKLINPKGDQKTKHRKAGGGKTNKKQQRNTKTEYQSESSGITARSTDDLTENKETRQVYMYTHRTNDKNKTQLGKVGTKILNA